MVPFKHIFRYINTSLNMELIFIHFQKVNSFTPCDSIEEPNSTGRMFTSQSFRYVGHAIELTSIRSSKSNIGYTQNATIK